MKCLKNNLNTMTYKMYRKNMRAKCLETQFGALLITIDVCE